MPGSSRGAHPARGSSVGAGSPMRPCARSDAPWGCCNLGVCSRRFGASPATRGHQALSAKHLGSAVRPQVLPQFPFHPPQLSPGAVTPVKDQAVCGSCWSFATTGAMEGALFLKTGVLTPLSQQVLIDCSWGFGNYACDGGEEWRAYEWIKKHGGIASTESYGSYKGQMLAKITGYVNVTSGNITAVKAAIYKHGPVAVSIDASHRTFSFYSNGVYYEPKCGESGTWDPREPLPLDHAVLAVGYGVLQGETYWLIKNSWSTYWGNDGYILMAMKDNNCGVATEATYPILA
uniref:Peptidase C1A papain C-terminal domain-containing protein n=1 Tax=Anas zonorhyncha TaxID=75864 RepID=A0A8B9W1Z9_9AVES